MRTHTPIVLLVDDSPIARRLVAPRLTVHGIVVREATSAADVMKAGPARDLACAVLDLDLEDGDGVEIARSLREAEPALPIAFFTAAEPECRRRAYAHGPVFEKPDVQSVVSWVLAFVRGR